LMSIQINEQQRCHCDVLISATREYVKVLISIDFLKSGMILI